MKIIRLLAFPPSLKGDVAVCYSALPYISIYTWNHLRDVFLSKYYLVFNKLNHKGKVNNLVAIPDESISRSWDRFIKS